MGKNKKNPCLNATLNYDLKPQGPENAELKCPELTEQLIWI